MRILVAVVIILHGLVHLLGFVVPWKFVTLAEMPYKVTLLSDKIDVGAGGIRIIGVLWLLATIGFVVVGGSLIATLPWWQVLAFAVTLFSLVLCILGWPDSQFGVYINLFILVFLLLGERFGLLPMS